MAKVLSIVNVLIIGWICLMGTISVDASMVTPMHCYEDTDCTDGFVCVEMICIPNNAEESDSSSSEDCDVDDACSSKPCKHGGECYLIPNECDNDPCNNGTCIDQRVAEYGCICKSKFIGANCETKIESISSEEVQQPSMSRRRRRGGRRGNRRGKRSRRN